MDALHVRDPARGPDGDRARNVRGRRARRRLRPQTFWHVTLPQLKPLILLALTFRLLDAVKLFDVIYVMTGGGPGSSTYTASFYLYQIGFQQFHLSKATAGSWIFSFSPRS